MSAHDAFTPALPHPVIWNGTNSQICHHMWQLYSHMVGPAAVILGFTVTTLWSFKAGAPNEMNSIIFLLFVFFYAFVSLKKKKKKRKRSAPEEAATQTERIQSCLSRPLKAHVIVF